MLLCDETQLEYISFSFAFFSVDKEKLGYYLPEGTYTTFVWDAARLCIKSPGNRNCRQHTAATPSRIEKSFFLFYFIDTTISIDRILWRRSVESIRLTTRRPSA
jgi:hypothetical protein